ncbi:MAG: purine-nucleoside phosphorylase [Bdellovibrionales bacterium]|nr:purine-nucleoside phosphorylase [Bdellovibrionales bacterium]
MDTFFKSEYKKINISVPEFHFVLGSGYGDAINSLKKENSFSDVWKEKLVLDFSKVPGLCATSVEGHGGSYYYFENCKTKTSICIQVGRLHGYEGLDPKLVVKTVTGPAMSGTKKFILTNAAGGLTEKFSVGSVMLINDHVNLTGKNPLYGPNPVDKNGTELGPRFLDLSSAYDKDLTKKMKDSLLKENLEVNSGIYLGLSGPTFETPAEVKLFALWNLHAVGMSTVWESIALNHIGVKVAGVSLISNLGCGLGDGKALDHNMVIEASKKSAHKILNALVNLV